MKGNFLPPQNGEMILKGISYNLRMFVAFLYFLFPILFIYYFIEGVFNIQIFYYLKKIPYDRYLITGSLFIGVFLFFVFSTSLHLIGFDSQEIYIFDNKFYVFYRQWNTQYRPVQAKRLYNIIHVFEKKRYYFLNTIVIVTTEDQFEFKICGRHKKNREYLLAYLNENFVNSQSKA